MLDRLIRGARHEAGLTQAELALRAETSQPAVARYEQGRAVPTLRTLERLLAACDRRVVVSAVAMDGSTGGPPSIGSVPDAELLHDHRESLLSAASRCGARNVRVFGSASRGEQTPDSDIDLLVELEPGRTLLDLASFRRQAHEILGVPVDVATADMLKERVRDEVLTQARPL
jgi:uncharacterized protein